MQAESDLTQMQNAVSVAEATQAVACVQQASSSSAMPATGSRQAEGGLALTAAKQDMEVDLDGSIVDGPEIAALYLVATELPVKLDENTATVLSQEVWDKSSATLARASK